MTQMSLAILNGTNGRCVILVAAFRYLVRYFPKLTESYSSTANACILLINYKLQDQDCFDIISSF